MEFNGEKKSEVTNYKTGQLFKDKIAGQQESVDVARKGDKIDEHLYKPSKGPQAFKVQNTNKKVCFSEFSFEEARNICSYGHADLL